MAEEIALALLGRVTKAAVKRERQVKMKQMLVLAPIYPFLGFKFITPFVSVQIVSINTVKRSSVGQTRAHGDAERDG